MKLFNDISVNIFNNKKVGLLIVGAQKCGTTSLHEYLNQHKDVIGSIPKEVDYFSYDGNYIKGKKWYHKHFKKKLFSGEKYLLDSSVEYMYIPNTWQRILKYNPEIKIIVLLRDPVERAYSAYHMYKRLNEGHGLKYYEKHIKEQCSNYKERMLSVLKSDSFPSYENYINLEIEMFEKSNDKFWYEPGFISRGMYYNQLRPFFDNFPQNNILVIDTMEFKLNKKDTLFKVFTWLGLEFEGDFSFDKEYLVGNYKKNIFNDLDIKLKSFFKEHNEKLFKLIKKDLNWNVK